MNRIILAGLLLLLSACATPHDGDGGLWSGTEVTQIAEDTYMIRVSQNGYTASSQLKPTALLLSKKVADQHGFKSFEILRISPWYLGPGNGQGVNCTVRFSRFDLPPVAGIRYSAGSPDVTQFDPKLDAQALKGLARLRSFSSGGGLGANIHVGPLFVDAIAASTSFWDGREFTAVKPGLQRMYFDAWLPATWSKGVRTALLPVTAELLPDKTYWVAGRLEEDGVSYWLEDADTGERLTEARSVGIGAQR
jgi:hypothetical protein